MTEDEMIAGVSPTQRTRFKQTLGGGKDRGLACCSLRGPKCKTEI